MLSLSGLIMGDKSSIVAKNSAYSWTEVIKSSMNDVWYMDF